MKDPNVATNWEVVTFAAAALGGFERPVHLEKISAKAFELTPGAFRWELDDYRNYPDKDKVRVSLTDAEKEKNGALIKSVGVQRAGISKRKDYWRLTPEGVVWFEENRKRLETILGAEVPKLKKGIAEKLRKQLTNSELWTEFAKTGTVSKNVYAFADLIEASPDAPNRTVQAKLDALMVQVSLIGNPSLVDFLREAATIHSSMLLQEEPNE